MLAHSPPVTWGALGVFGEGSVWLLGQRHLSAAPAEIESAHELGGGGEEGVSFGFGSPPALASAHPMVLTKAQHSLKPTHKGRHTNFY